MVFICFCTLHFLSTDCKTKENSEINNYFILVLEIPRAVLIHLENTNFELDKIKKYFC